MPPRLVAILQLLLLILSGSLMVVLSKGVLRAVPAHTFYWLQLAVALVTLTLYQLVRAGTLRVPRLDARSWTYVAAIGINTFLGWRLLFLVGLYDLPATTHAYLVNFVGIATMVLSVLLLREHPSLWQMVGALVALAGVSVFFRSAPPPGELYGASLLVIGIMLLALNNILVRKLALRVGERVPAAQLTMLTLWLGGLPVIVHGAWTSHGLPAVEGEHLLVIALYAVVGIAFGQSVYQHLLRTLRSYEAAVFSACGVVFSALFALPILGEQLGWHQVAGIVLMLVGIALAQWRGVFKLRMWARA
ncbi:DMT family transporter [Chitinolyticbacter meiyuanensis]|uniref:DMT family transporter n=1 Tax=Chitinolyticbacter meiyuanensis TaxID=682798 RepID=UPI0016522C55|nr:DMT family transporter [Chitinolyticbacter meiyuanensis]